MSQYHDDEEEHVTIKEYTPEQLKAIARQGFTCVSGGIVLHIMLGGFSAWGSIRNYAYIIP
jgi:hypothetical protein